MTDLELFGIAMDEIVLDLTEEWHLGLNGSADYTLPEWIEHKTGLVMDKWGFFRDVETSEIYG